VRAIVYQRHGGPEVLEAKDVPDPAPADGEVLVDIEAVGVNYRDVYERTGAEAGSKVPAIIGVEGAGTIAGTGERVAWSRIPGSYAQRVAARRELLVAVPDDVPSDLAAAAMLQGMTAHYLSHDAYPIEEDDWVLVHAAAGGVGLLLTQLAKLRGGRVIATTSSAEKAKLAREAGADRTIGYDDFGEAAVEISGGGVAAVYDGIGKATFDESLTALRPFGRMILYGSASGQPDPFPVPRLAALGSLYVQRPTLKTYTRTPELLRERAAAVFALVGDDTLDVRIGERYPLDHARRAHVDLEARRTTGKLLLVP
jgi:NADPH2:quinone reductase